MVGPTGNYEHVSLLPVEADAPNDRGATSFEHMVDGAVHLAMRFGVNSRPNHLNPCCHRIHDRPARVRICIFQGDVIKWAGIGLGQIIERPFGSLPLVCEDR